MAIQNKRERINVLIIDDSPPMLILMAKIVTGLGYLARPVMNTRQARMALDKFLPDLILLDLSMPEMSGFEFCMEVKREERYREIPIIVVTGYEAQSYKLRAYRLGAVEYLVKPFVNEELSYKVKFHIEVKLKQEGSAITINHLQMMLQSRTEELQQEQMQFIHFFLYILEAKGYNVEKCKRVAKYAKELAVHLQLLPQYETIVDAKFLEQFERIAPLYDIGMLCLQEGDGQELHTVEGRRMLERLQEKHPGNPYLNMAKEVVTYHHEQGEVPLVARILSIALAYEEEGKAALLQKGFDLELVLLFLKIEEKLVK